MKTTIIALCFLLFGAMTGRAQKFTSQTIQGQLFWGLEDENGTMISPLKYNDAKLFKNGYGQVFLNGKWGIIDSLGKETTALKYDKLYHYDFSQSEGLWAVMLDNKWGFIDRNGKEIIPPKYEDWNCN